MTHELWAKVSEFLQVACPQSRTGTYSCIPQKKGSCEMPFSLQDTSNGFFGKLRIQVLSETPFLGDQMELVHGLEITSQK